jgi:hypothetical protein
LAFYTLCNEHNRILAVIHFTLLYTTWKKENPDNPHTCACTYYDMQLKKLQMIHPPHPPESSEAIPLGIDATGNAESIKTRLAVMF